MLAKIPTAAPNLPIPGLQNIPAAPFVVGPGPAPAGPAPLAGDNNAATAGPMAAPIDVDIEQIKLEGFGAAVRAGLFNDGKLDSKEQKFIADLAHFLWPGGQTAAQPHNPVGGAGPVAPAATTPPPAPAGQTLVGSTLVQGRTFSTVGDPHETTGDGHKFDNMEDGDFVKLTSASGDFGLQTTQGNDIQGRWGADFGINQTPPKYATLNQRAAVKAGPDTVEYLALGKDFNYDKYPRATDGKMGTPTLKINGQEVPMPKAGEVIKLPGGGTVTGMADGVSIDSGRGGIPGKAGSNDVVNIRQPKQENGKPETYINVDGQVGEGRKDKEVRGSLGGFDTDTDGGNDRLPRGSNKPLATDKELIDEWRVRPGEKLFKAANPTGGAGPTKDAIDQEFDKLDTSKEGYLDGAEIPADIKAALPGKTRVSRQEFRQVREAAAEAAAVKKDEADFKALDKNGSGWLSGNEATSVLGYDKGNNFKGADGKEVVEISKAEFMAGRKAAREKAKATAANPAGGAGPVKPAAPANPVGGAGPGTAQVGDVNFSRIIKDFKGKIAAGDVKLAAAKAKLRGAKGIFARIKAMKALNKVKAQVKAERAEAKQFLAGAATAKGLDAKQVVKDATARGHVQGATEIATAAQAKVDKAEDKLERAGGGGMFNARRAIAEAEKRAAEADAARANEQLGRVTLQAPKGADPFDNIKV